MKRRLNYTGRIKIQRKRIGIIFNKQNGRIASFVLKKLDLEGLNLPANARVFVEAYYRTELRRFDCGSVGALSLPKGDLSNMAYTENIKFRIIIADPNNWKILAHADKIAPEPSQKQSILPVDFSRNLGNLVWMIEYEGENGGPILYINSRIPDKQNMAKRNPEFFVYVYPSAIKEILTHMVFIDGVDSVSDPVSDWHKDWLTFSNILNIEPPDVLDPSNDDFDKERAIEWINDVIDGFCKKYESNFDEFIKMLTQMEETT